MALALEKVEEGRTDLGEPGHVWSSRWEDSRALLWVLPVPCKPPLTSVPGRGDRPHKQVRRPLGQQRAPFAYRCVGPHLAFPAPGISAGIGENQKGSVLGGGGGAMTWNASAVPTDAVAIVGATTGQTFTVKWMD